MFISCTVADMPELAVNKDTLPNPLGIGRLIEAVDLIDIGK